MVASYHINSAYKGIINRVLLSPTYELLIPARVLTSRKLDLSHYHAVLYLWPMLELETLTFLCNF